MAGPRFHAELGLRALRSLRSTGLVAPIRPDRLGRMLLAPLRAGIGPETIVAAGAARHPDRVAVLDELGTLTYAELDARAASVAAGLSREFRVGPDRSLGIMCRNHRGFVEAMLAASRCGADLLLLNTDFSGPQLGEVVEREKPGAIVADDEYSEAFDAAGFADRRVVAWQDDGATSGATTLEALIGAGGRPPRSFRQGRVVMLTSGTTGTPKGAPHDPSPGALIGPWVSLVDKIPLRTGEPLLVGPPFFHAFGFSYLALGLVLGGKIVMRRRFDPDAALEAIQSERVTTAIGVPVMLQRILKSYEEGGRRHDVSSLRSLISAAAPLTPALSEALMDAFGDVVYNLYGSTETGFGGIAGPADLRAAPGTVGHPPYGTTVKILDDNRRELPPGEPGHIFIGGDLAFEGYTGGGSKETVDGLMNTGDLGHLDAEGRLFIDGREDDMIVSGGENVFPKEVEDLLARHAGVDDVAVVGVEDEDFGQRLKAFVVAAGSETASEDELKDYVKQNLARYKVPREVVFVDELPRNPTGKLLKGKLPSSDGA